MVKINIGWMGITGIILMILGLLLFAYPYAVVMDYESLGGEIARALSEQERQEYQTMKTAMYGTAALTIGGFIMTVVDLATD